MEDIKISKEKLFKIKETIIFVLLFLWMAMPIFQTIKPLYSIINIKECYFALMKITGIVGIVFSIIYIIYKIKKSENKKETLKEILPIFLFTLYMGWTLLACFLSPNTYFAFNGNSYRQEGYFMYINYAGFFLCAFLLKNKKLRKILLNTFIISSVYLIFICRICLNGYRFRNIFVNTSIHSTVFAQFNHYGYYLMMSLMCCFGLFMSEKNKILKVIYLLAYAIIGYGTIYNETFGCYLAVAVTLILYAIYSLIKKTDRKSILVAITVFVLLSCTTYRGDRNIAYHNIKDFASEIKTIIYKVMDIEIEEKVEEQEQVEEAAEEDNNKEEAQDEFEQIGTNRMKLWKNGIKFVLERPVIGYGPDNLRLKYMYEDINQDRPHNLLIYLAAVSGIPGMLIYVTAVGIIVVKGILQLFRKNKNTLIYLAVVITYLISAMFGNSMPYTSPYFFIFLGSLMHFNLRKQDE